MPDQTVKSAARALEIIDYIAMRGSRSFSEIQDDLALPRSSAHGLLHTLVASGWLTQNVATRRFTLGLKSWQTGQEYDGHRMLVDKATPIMRELTAYTGETVQMARLDGIENVYIAISESPNPMRLASRIGMRLHAHATGIGKALLSTLNADDARARLSSVILPRLTEKTMTDVDEIMDAVTRTRFTGYATDDEEFVIGCRCVAVPVTRADETGIAAAMSITAPIARATDGWPHVFYAPLQEAVSRIRAAVGLPDRLR